MLQQMEETMKSMTKNWWIFIVRGVLAILFGILVVAWPIEAIFILVIFFGAYVLVDGIFSLIFASTHKEGRGSRAWLIIVGIIGVIAGIIALAWPGITSLVLLILIAAWALVAGIAQLIFAFTAAKNTGNRLMLALGGVFSIILGIFLFARPAVGALAVIWIIGIFAVMIGIYLIMFGISLKGLNKEGLLKQA